MLVAVEVPNCQLAFGEHLRVVGSCAELGSWDAAAAPALEWSEGDCWAGELALPPGEHAFKLVVVRQDGSQQWEEGGDRSLLVPAVAAAAAPVGLPALRATCRFGNTACIDVEESSGSEADEPLPQVRLFVCCCRRRRRRCACLVALYLSLLLPCLVLPAACAGASQRLLAARAVPLACSSCCAPPAG